MTDKPRHLIDIASLDDADISQLIERACALASGAQPASLGTTAVNLFLEPSTRTRVSFELAAGRTGMRVVNIAPRDSSIAKGEALADTAGTLAAMGVDALVLRHPESGVPVTLADDLDGAVRVINAGDGTRAHPSQALLDAATLRSQGIETRGLKMAVVGDLRHSRVAASGLALWPRLGVGDLRLAAPPGLMPDEPPAGARVCASLEEAIEGVDVVMMLRVQLERMASGERPDGAAYFREWGLQPEHLEAAAKGCRVMHPGPFNRGVEIDSRVADGPASLIREQVRMGVFTRMAIFEWT